MATSAPNQSSTDEMEDKAFPGCSSCSDDGSYIAAEQYCVECEMYFCGKCVKYHNKMPTLKSHQVKDVDSSDVDNVDGKRRAGVPESLKCSLHPGQCINTYCNDHDEVCCETCCSVEHRLCTKEPIAMSAKGFTSSPEINQGKEYLSDLLTRLDQEKQKRIDNLELVGTEQSEHIEVVNTWEEEAILKIKKLADKSRPAIHAKYVEHKTAIDRDVTDIDASVTALKAHEQIIEKTRDNEQLLFANVKSIKTRSRGAERLILAMSAEWKERTIPFHVDYTFKEAIHKQASLGQVGNGFNEYNTRFLNAINARRGNKYQPSNIKDICLVDSGDILVILKRAYKVRRYDSGLQFTGELKLSSPPVAVCQVGAKEVAVRLPNSKVVQILSLDGPLTSTTSLTLHGDGYGMVYDAGSDELYTCEEDKIGVYRKDGTKVRTIDEDENGEQIFTACRQITLSDNKQDLYVTDMNEGLVVLDKNGALKWKVPLNGVGDEQPLCLLPGQTCLVGIENGTVITQFNKYGTQLRNLIDQVGHSTYCAVYDRDRSRLIVGGDVGGDGDKSISTYSITDIDGAA